MYRWSDPDAERLDRRPSWTRPSRPSSTIPAGRCWCWPVRAPARPPRWSSRWSTGSSAAASTPDRILVLTFSRKAAADLRTRIAGRLGRTVVTPMAMTFHAFCYALVRRFADRSSPARRARRCRLLTGARAGVPGPARPCRAAWRPGGPTGRTSLARAFPTRAFAGEVRAVLARARQLGHGSRGRRRGRRGGRPRRSGWASGSSSRSTSTCWTPRGCSTTPNWCTAAGSCWPTRRWSATLRREIDEVFVDEYQDTDPAQVRLLQAIAGDGRDVVVVGDPDQSIYALPRRRGAGHPRLPGPVPHRRRRAGAGAAPWPRPGGSGRRCSAASRNVAGRLGMPRALPPEVFAKFRAAARRRRACLRVRSRSSPAAARAPRPSTSPRSCAAPTCATACPGTRWPCWSARAGPRFRA